MPLCFKRILVGLGPCVIDFCVIGVICVELDCVSDSKWFKLSEVIIRTCDIV